MGTRQGARQGGAGMGDELSHGKWYTGVSPANQEWGTLTTAE